MHIQSTLVYFYIYFFPNNDGLIYKSKDILVHLVFQKKKKKKNYGNSN